jgi:predicted RNase H-like HicB family nuclease
MEEIIFIVKESQEGGYEARAVGFSIFAEGDDYEEIKHNIRDAVRCHFEEEIPRLIRIHYVREEIIAA